jgi:hypothetical protein
MSSKVPKKKTNKKPLVSVDLNQPETTETTEHVDELQKQPDAGEIIKEDLIIKDAEPEEEEKGEEEDNDGYYYAPSTKPKKPRTEKQLEQLRQARVKALVNKEMKRKEKEKEEEAKRKIIEETKQEQKKALEQKIVKKALSIKKKEIKKQEVLDEISDDETPIEKIKIPKKKAETTPQKKNIIYFD